MHSVDRPASTDVQSELSTTDEILSKWCTAWIKRDSTFLKHVMTS